MPNPERAARNRELLEDLRKLGKPTEQRFKELKEKYRQENKAAGHTRAESLELAEEKALKEVLPAPPDETSEPEEWGWEDEGYVGYANEEEWDRNEDLDCLYADLGESEDLRVSLRWVLENLRELLQGDPSPRWDKVASPPPDAECGFLVSMYRLDPALFAEVVAGLLQEVSDVALRSVYQRLIKAVVAARQEVTAESIG